MLVHESPNARTDSSCLALWRPRADRRRVRAVHRDWAEQALAGFRRLAGEMSYGRRSLIQTPPVCSTTGSTTWFPARPISSTWISGSSCAAGPSISNFEERISVQQTALCGFLEVFDFADPAGQWVPSGTNLGHQPPLACIRERATVGKPSFRFRTGVGRRTPPSNPTPLGSSTSPPMNTSATGPPTPTRYPPAVCRWPGGARVETVLRSTLPVIDRVR